jgi:hypothetical protein
VDVFAAYERQVIKLRTKSALRARRERNLRVSRWPPFGFTFDKNGRTRPVPSQQETLKRMMTLRRRGLSYAEIGRGCCARGGDRRERRGGGSARCGTCCVGTTRPLDLTYADRGTDRGVALGGLPKAQ